MFSIFSSKLIFIELPLSDFNSLFFNIPLVEMASSPPFLSMILFGIGGIITNSNSSIIGFKGLIWDKKKEPAALLTLLLYWGFQNSYSEFHHFEWQSCHELVPLWNERYDLKIFRSSFSARNCWYKSLDFRNSFKTINTAVATGPTMSITTMMPPKNALMLSACASAISIIIKTKRHKL